MHLDTLKIQRFRSCADVTVQFRKDMTVLVGENNGGKSNIVDAIRLLTLPLSGRRERYAEDEDLRRGSPDPSFTIEGAFRGLSDTLKGLLISAVPDPTTDLAIWGLRYQCGTVKVRGRVSLWAGRLAPASGESPDATAVRVDAPADLGLAGADGLTGERRRGPARQTEGATREGCPRNAQECGLLRHVRPRF